MKVNQKQKAEGRIRRRWTWRSRRRTRKSKARHKMAAGNDVMRGFCLFCCCCFCPFLSTATATTTTTEEATHNNNNSNSNNNITFTTNINKGAAVAASLKLTSLLFYNLQKLPCLARLDFSFGLFFFCAVIAFAFAACSRLRSLRPFPLSLLFIKSYNVVLLARFQMFFNRDCFACCPPAAVTDCLLKPSSRLFKYLYGCTHTHTHTQKCVVCMQMLARGGGGSQLGDNALQRPKNDTD